MAQKIVRDIGKKGSLVISMKDADLAKPREKIVHVVDLSGAGKQKFVITRTERKKKEEQVFFLHIDAEKKLHFDRINEVIRVSAAGVLILLVINLINVYQRGMVIKNNVIAAASTGYEDLMGGGEKAQTGDFASAEGSFAEATASFNQALGDISFLQTNRDAFFAREKTVDSVQGLLEAAKSLSEAGGDFSRGIENLKQLPALFLQANGQPIYAPTVAAAVAAPKFSLTGKLKEDLIFLENATEKIRTADKNLRRVSADVLPPQLKDKLDEAKSKVKKLLSLLESTQRKIPALLDLLGDRYPHRYLVLLQNDTEARPTGGFIGSFMIIDINDGYITKMEFRDVYEADGQLKEEIPAPEDIAKITKNWRLRDSNYSPDFAVSAEKAAWFLQKEKGPSVDTVIAINQSILADLLAITGPVQIESLSAPLDENNYKTVLSYVIESKLSGPDKPKKVLNEFIGAFQKKLFSSGSWQKTLGALINGYQRKAILIYSRHEEVQKVLDDLGMSGRIIKTKPGEDYLNVITTSIGGNKSDLYIQQSIQHNTLVNNTGLLMDEVTIKRKHTWTEKHLEQIMATLGQFGFTDVSDTVKDILGRGVNKSYVKLYVPKGSKILETAGIGPDQVMTREDVEIDKTYFMFEMDVAPGSEKKVTITYQLPRNLELLPVNTYRFHAQNQPGARSSWFVKQIFFKPGLQSYKEYPAEVLKKYESGNLYFDGNLEKDLYLSAVVGS